LPEYPLLRQYESDDSTKLLQVVDWLKQNNFKEKAAEVYRFLKTWQPAINSIQTDSFVNGALNDTKWLALRNNAKARLKGVDLNGVNELIFRFAGYKPGGQWTIHLDRADGPVLTTMAIPQTKGWAFNTASFPVQTGTHDLYFSYRNPTLKTPTELGIQFDWFYFTQAFPGKDKKGYDTTYKHWWNLLTKEVPTIPVMMDNPSFLSRNTNVFVAGNWLVKGEKVEPGVPASLNPFPNNAPKNRLGLAQWLTDKRNPLTARTMVNRLWEQLYGAGLVETLGRHGHQGSRTHTQRAA
jgi:hypothetical protein